VGTREGAKASVAACFGSIGDVSMGFVTGVPLACGLELLLKGSLTQHGVLAPESGAIDPHEFFTALDAKEGSGGGIGGSSAEMLVLTRSWDPDARKSYRESLAKALAE
jgi:saccharopine dehydrogenase-like NADP-dependent oxidoreductase